MTFRVGVTSDILDAKGEPVFGRAPLEALEVPGLDWAWLPKGIREIGAEHAAQYRGQLSDYGEALTRALALSTPPVLEVLFLRTGERVELATAPEAGALITRYVGADAVRLSPASLETLAIVAYRQPVTKAAVERVRGVDSDYTIRTLLHRRLIVELGRSGAPGRPILYGTGFDFLERFGLVSLEQLPPLAVDVAARLAEEGGEGIAIAAGEVADGGEEPVEPAD